MIVKLPLDKIIIPQGLLPRIFGVNEEKVEEYAEAMENGAEFPPIKVWEKQDGTYQVIDGVHRISACRKLGKKYIEAEIVKGIKDEVEFMEKAIQENLKHGLPLSKEDKRENARRLYIKGYTPKQLAKLFSVSERTVYNWIGDLKDKEKLEKEKLKQKAIELKDKGYTQEEIAEELKVSQKTISNWLNSLVNFENFQNLLNPEDLEEEYEETKTQFTKTLEEKKKQALELHSKGYEVEEISKELGVNEITVSRWIKDEEGGIYTTIETEEYDGSWDDWNDDEQEQQVEQPQQTKKQPKEKKLLHPNQIFERCKNEIWDAIIEIEYHFGDEKALEVLEEIYFAYKERKHKGLTIYKDRRALFIYNKQRGR